MCLAIKFTDVIRPVITALVKKIFPCFRNQSNTVWSPRLRKGGENEITENPKRGGLFDSVDEKGVLVKGVEQG